MGKRIGRTGKKTGAFTVNIFSLKNTGLKFYSNEMFFC